MPVNGWCAKEWHHYCPESPSGGLAGNGGDALVHIHPCACWCHDGSGQPPLPLDPTGAIYEGLTPECEADDPE